ncbi:hypothetical protein CRM22_000091 [Opisthorchis felineus]|uniref:Uncharacterized protein n=1 Tax=Opisthorchis felineus TaxID=147828 RepID=A0A4S2MGX3_OPIFE|nr:hypothetical protein CRM22_000091 [Opisthorchis felineus]
MVTARPKLPSAFGFATRRNFLHSGFHRTGRKESEFSVYHEDYMYPIERMLQIKNVIFYSRDFVDSCGR